MHETRNCQWTRHSQFLSIWECQIDTMLQVEMWNSVQKTCTRSHSNDRMQSRNIRRQLGSATLNLNAVEFVRIDGLRPYVLARLTSALQTGVPRAFQIEIIRVSGHF